MSTPEPEIPDVQPKPRRTKAIIEYENTRLLDLLRIGAQPYEIKKDLKLTDSNYRKRLRVLAQRDLDTVLSQQTAQAKAELMYTCIRKIEALEIEANKMIIAGDLRPLEKAAIMDRIRQYALDKAKLMSEGPYLFKIVRDGLHRGSLPEPTEPEHPTPLPTTDPDPDPTDATF